MLKELFSSGNILIDLSVSRWDGQGKLEPASIGLTELELPPELIKLGWRGLLPKDERARLMSMRSQARAFLDVYALPFPISGVRFIPAGNVKMIMDKLQQFKEEDETLVASFLGRYEEIRLRVLAEYPPAFHAAITEAYPTLDYVRSRFDFRFRVFIVDEAPQSNGESLSKDTDDWLGDVIELLRGEVGDIAERVIKTIDKGQSVSKLQIAALRRVLGQFLARNLCKDAEVSAAVTRVTALLDQYDGEAFLAKNPTPRADLRGVLSAVCTAAAVRADVPGIVAAYTRRLMLEP